MAEPKRELSPERVIGTALAAAAFVFQCWMLANNDIGDLRMLAGPVGFLRTQSMADKATAVILVVILLPAIFAVGIRRNAITVVLAALGLVGWVVIGFWIEGSASC
jgi:hypothetical protein